jgi:SAM-dependent methyltransferase
VVGIDLSEPMLRVARRRLRSVHLLKGDMRSFRLAERFDVVSCLYSAIGHLRSEIELARTLRNFERHLEPGGLCLVEPWIDPADFRPGFVQAVSCSEPTSAVARMAVSGRQGRRSVIHYEYLVGDAGHGIRHFAEDETGLLVPRERLLSLAERSHLRARFLAKGLTPGRGLLIGRKPVQPEPRRSASGGGGRRA